MSESMEKRCIKYVEIVPVSNEECEHRFSIMNNIVTATRNALVVENVPLLTVNSPDPPISHWDPLC